MSGPIPVRDHVTTGAVPADRYEHLRRLVAPHHWEPLISYGDGSCRAWLRTTVPMPGRPSRIFARPGATPQEAVERLIAKVEPMARGAS